MNRLTRATAALLTLAAIAAAGAGSVRGAEPEPELGATIEATLYAAEDRTLTVWNRSNVEVLASLEPTGGWSVEPAEMTLAPDETAEVEVTGDGADGAALTVRMVATASPPPGEQASELALAARLYTERPTDLAPIVLGAALALIATITAALVVRRRLRAP